MQDLSGDLYSLLHDVLTQLPSLFAMVICILVAIVRWKRHPTVSLIVILTLTFLILQTLVFAVVFVWASRWVVSLGNTDDTQSIYAVIGIIYNVLFALALGVLLLSIFIQRPLVSRS